MRHARILAKSLDKWSFKKKILVITGARQVGKTTMLKNMLNNLGENCLYINAEEPSSRRLFEDANVSDLKELIGDNKVLVIDEAQVIENIGRCLKMIADNFPDLQVYATGSSALDIADKIFEPLTGRHFLFHLYPMALSELYSKSQRKQLMDNLDWHLVYGMYPDAINNKPDAAKYIKSISGAYLYKDVLAWKDLRKPELLHKLLQLLAHQIGSEVSTQELAVQLKVKSETVESYLDLLEKCFVIHRMRSYSTNDRKEVTKMKKIYFWDNGVRNAIIDNFNPAALRSDMGALWENFIIAERMKMNHYLEKNITSKFWRSKQQQEVDYVEQEGNELRAYEMKYHEHSKAKVSRAFTNLYPHSTAAIISPKEVVAFTYS